MSPKDLINMILTGQPIPERYRSLVAHALHDDKYLKLAMRVSELRARGIGLHDYGAIDMVSRETGESVRTCERAWSRHKALLGWCR